VRERFVVWPTIPLVRPPLRACSPVPVNCPSRRFGSCSLKGAPTSFFACGNFTSRFRTSAFRPGVDFLATTNPPLSMCVFLLQSKRQVPYRWKESNWPALPGQSLGGHECPYSDFRFHANFATRIPRKLGKSAAMYCWLPALTTSGAAIGNSATKNNRSWLIPKFSGSFDAYTHVRGPPPLSA